MKVLWYLFDLSYDPVEVCVGWPVNLEVVFADLINSLNKVSSVLKELTLLREYVDNIYRKII